MFLEPRDIRRSRRHELRYWLLLLGGCCCWRCWS
jgi:hypothetical protein